MLAVLGGCFASCHARPGLSPTGAPSLSACCPPCAGLLQGIEQKSQQSAEYGRLLADCQALYCEVPWHDRIIFYPLRCSLPVPAAMLLCNGCALGWPSLKLTPATPPPPPSVLFAWQARVSLMRGPVAQRIASYASQPLPSVLRSGCAYLMQARPGTSRNCWGFRAGIWQDRLSWRSKGVAVPAPSLPCLGGGIFCTGKHQLHTMPTFPSLPHAVADLWAGARPVRAPLSLLGLLPLRTGAAAGPAVHAALRRAAPCAGPGACLLLLRCAGCALSCLLRLAGLWLGSCMS